MDSALPNVSIRVIFAPPPRGSGDPVAIQRALSTPSETMGKALSLGLQKMTQVISRERFTGTGPFPVAQNRLGNITGETKRLLHSEPVSLSPRGYKARMGSIVEYLGAHEMGFDGTVQVPAHTRKAYTVDRPARTRTSKKGKEVSIRANSYSVLPQSVRAHSKKLKIARRAPLRTGIEQHGEKILGDAIRAGLKQITSRKA